MALPATIGLPLMNKEASEKRVFLPQFIQFLSRFADVYLENDYGARLNLTFEAYAQGNPRVHQTDRMDTFQKNYVLVLRSPSEEEFLWLRPGTCLISMLHYPTRPQRVEMLQELGIHAISLDSIADDTNLRLIENMRSVAWNGLESAFNLIEQDCPNLIREGRPFYVLVLGTGMVGKHAVEAATKLGSIERNLRHINAGGSGAMAVCIGRNLSSRPDQMEDLMRRADVLVDATNRSDPGVPVVPNAWLNWLPAKAVIADLAVDPYLLNQQPKTVRGVEGIPQGNLDKFSFTPNDPAWDLTVPASVDSQHRRSVVSCYSWPGIHPEACMQHYARQLEPLMEVLMTRPYQEITLEGSYFERALARAKLPGG